MADFMPPPSAAGIPVDQTNLPNVPPTPPQTTSPQLSGQIPQQPVQNAPATVQVPAAAVPHLSKMAAIGQFVHGMGSDSGTPTQQLFGRIFRGALVGMGAGAENADSRSAGSGLAAFGKGGAAGIQQAQLEQQRAAQQKQQAFENNLKTQNAASEETLRKAQIGMYNMEKLKDLHAIQTGDYTSHKDMVSDAAPIVEAYKATGLRPVVENISETDHEAYVKAHPGAATLDWQPTGVTSYVDSDGRINYQTQWSAYDPKGSITLPSSTISDWKDSGLLAQNPNLLNNLKKDPDGQYQIPYSAFTSLASQNNQLKATAKQKQADDFTTKENNMKLSELATRMAQERAATAASGDEAAQRAFELKQEKAGVDAQTALTKAGGDWAKLTPDQKVALQPQIQKDIDGYRNELNDPILKEQLQSNDPDVVKDAQARAATLHEQLDNARKHSIYVDPSKVSTTQAPNDPVKLTLDFIASKGLEGDAAFNQIDNSSVLTPAQKQQARTQIEQKQAENARSTRSTLKNIVTGVPQVILP